MPLQGWQGGQMPCRSLGGCGGGGMGAAGIDRCIDHARKVFGFENAKSLIPNTGKNNRFLFLDILGYLKKIIPTKIPNLEEWDKSQSGNSLVPTCLTLPNLGFLWVFFKYPKISKNGNPLFFPVWYFYLNTHRNFSNTWASRRQLKTHLKKIKSFLRFKWWPCGASWK